MVSVNPQYTMTGVAITESEEDPGLGALIEEDYFRNQFVGKTIDFLPKLKVIKKPLPKELEIVCEPNSTAYKELGPEKVAAIKKKHLKDDIYALTGATISSRAVTLGVKNTVKKFHYRFDILAKAIKEQNIQARPHWQSLCEKIIAISEINDKPQNAIEDLIESHRL